MKKIILILFVLFTSISTNAQENEYEKKIKAISQKSHFFNGINDETCHKTKTTHKLFVTKQKIYLQTTAITKKAKTKTTYKKANVKYLIASEIKDDGILLTFSKNAVTNNNQKKSNTILIPFLYDCTNKIYIWTKTDETVVSMNKDFTELAEINKKTKLE